MKVAIVDIPEDGLRREYTMPVSVSADEEPYTASASLTLTRVGRKVTVRGEIHIKGSLRCSRCLEHFDDERDLSFFDEYTPLSESSIEPEYELSSDELDISYYEQDEIDIDELINEQVMLSMPLKPLCKPECRGLCPKCGKNLNEGLCDCQTDKIDARFEILRQLKDSMHNR